MYVLAAILVVAMIVGLRAQKKLNNYMDEMGQVNRTELPVDRKSLT